MDNLKDDFLEPICKNFGYHLEAAVKERDGPIIINCLWGIFLGYESDESIVEAFQVQFARVKFFT